MPPVVPATSGIFIIPYIRMKIKKNPTEAVNVPASVRLYAYPYNSAGVQPTI